MATAKDAEGNILVLGDWVEFKSDIEQRGQIAGISACLTDSGFFVRLQNPNGFEGEYIGGDTETVMPAERVYKIHRESL